MAGSIDVRGRASARPWLTQRRREELTAYLFIAPWIIGFLIFTAGAMLFSLVISLSDTDLLTISKFIGIKNYTKALTGDSLFIKALIVTAWYTVMVVPCGTITAMLIALLLNQKVWPIGVWRTIYYLPALVSGVAVALLWGWVSIPTTGWSTWPAHGRPRARAAMVRLRRLGGAGDGAGRDLGHRHGHGALPGRAPGRSRPRCRKPPRSTAPDRSGLLVGHAAAADPDRVLQRDHEHHRVVPGLQQAW